MAIRDRAAPAFIKNRVLQALQARLPAKLAEVREKYLASEGVDVPLPFSQDEENPKIRRTKPAHFGEVAPQTLVLFARHTAFDARESAEKIKADQTLLTPNTGELIQPAKGVYGTTLQVEFYCQNPSTVVEGLDEAEVINIQCQNTIWGAYLCMLDIGDDPVMESEGLRLIEVSEGMNFDNTRGDDWPLTEYGTFAFRVFVG